MLCCDSGRGRDDTGTRGPERKASTAIACHAAIGCLRTELQEALACRLLQQVGLDESFHQR